MKFLESVVKFLESLSKWLKLVGSVEKGVQATIVDLKEQMGQKVEVKNDETQN